MKKSSIKSFTLTLLMLLVAFLVPVLSGDCYAMTDKELPTKFGSISVPKDSYVLEYNLSSAKTGNLSEEAEVLEKYFNLYHIAINDGESYKDAIIFTGFLDKELLENKNMRNILGSSNMKDIRISPQQYFVISMLQENAKVYMDLMVAEYVKNNYNTKTINKITFAKDKDALQNPSGLIKFEWSNIQRIEINGQYAYKTDVRAICNLSGIITTFYLKGYVFNVDEKGLGMVLFGSVDSQREYWQDVLSSRMENNLKTF